MRKYFPPIAVAAAAMVLVAPTSFAAPPKARPIFTFIPNDAPWHRATPVHTGAPLVQWDGSFTDHTGQTITYTMVGTDPSNTNVATLIPVVIIPVKMVYGVANGNRTFNPKTAILPNGQSVLKNTTVSPLFTNSIDYVQGGVNLGKAQYIDAYQRGNFWSYVSGHKSYHVKLGHRTMVPTVTYNVSPALGQVMNNPFGPGVIGTMDYEIFDQQIQTWMAQISEPGWRRSPRSIQACCRSFSPTISI